MPFKILVKDQSLAFKNGDPVELAPSLYPLKEKEDYTAWLANGNAANDWPSIFYLIHITDVELDGTESEVQYIMSPYDAFNPDAAFKRRYNIQLTGSHLTAVNTLHETSMDWATLETFIVDRLA